MKTKLTAILLLTFLLSACARDTVPPEVVRTIPANGDQSVDPALTTLSVTFSEPMMDGSWSWAYTKPEDFPEMKGDPRFENDRITNLLPVKLEPNKQYIVWINSDKFRNFKDRAGNSRAPYRLAFKTR